MHFDIEILTSLGIFESTQCPPSHPYVGAWVCMNRLVNDVICYCLLYTWYLLAF